MTNQGIVEIPLNKLVKSDNNVRKTGGSSIEELAASIRSHGLLQNLSVIEQVKKGKPTGKFAVVAGARRHTALLQLAKQKVITGQYAIPCLVVDLETALEKSLAENVVREAMHPADEFTAFQAMSEKGIGVEDIAARFGVTAKVVKQRLKLANVSPRLFALYREDGINLSQLIALAVSDDHAAQERVWDAAQNHWRKEPRELRAALTENKIDAATDPRARYVGTEAYAAAGGQIERDLFQDEHDGYLTDGELLDRLVAENLETLSEAVKAEGWKWIEVRNRFDHSDLSSFGHICPVQVPLPTELQVEIESLKTERDKIQQEHGEGDEFPIAVEKRLDEIESRLEELNEREEEYRGEEKEFAGAIISLRNDGQPYIHRGLVKPEDKRQLNAVKCGGSPATSDITEGDQDSGLSAALVEDLTTHRTAAMRANLITQPNIALVTITHNLAVQVCYETPAWDLPTTVAIAVERNSLRLDGHAKDIESSPAQKALNEKRDHFHRILPEDPKKLWDWLLERNQSEVMDLLAFCVAQTVNAIRLPHQSSLSRHAAADDLADAMSLDMAAWWTPTVDGYLGRVKKDQLIADLIEATGEVEDVEAFKAMKKVDLAAEVEKRMSKTGWLPEILRA